MRTSRICLLGTLAALALRPAVAQTADEPSQSVKTALDRILPTSRRAGINSNLRRWLRCARRTACTLLLLEAYTGQAGMQQ